MLAVFSRPRELSQSPMSPVGTKRRLLEHQSLTPEEEEYVNSVLDNLYRSLPRRSHSLINEHTFGGGANGIAWVESITHVLAEDREGDVCAFFKGSLENRPEEEELEDAEFILQEYKKAFDTPEAGMGGATPTLEVLSRLRGPFAFLIFDRLNGRIVAARDASGEEPLAWGTTLLSEGVLFASDKSLIEGECADAEDFPPGAVFVSNRFSTSGTLSTIGPEGGVGLDAADAAQRAEVLCRVESGSQLQRAESEVEAS